MALATCAQVVYFDCNAWLSAEQGKGLLERTLPATAADTFLARCPYQVCFCVVGRMCACQYVMTA